MAPPKLPPTIEHHSLAAAWDAANKRVLRGPAPVKAIYPLGLPSSQFRFHCRTIRPPNLQDSSSGGRCGRMPMYEWQASALEEADSGLGERKEGSNRADTKYLRPRNQCAPRNPREQTTCASARSKSLGALMRLRAASFAKSLHMIAGSFRRTQLCGRASFQSRTRSPIQTQSRASLFGNNESLPVARLAPFEFRQTAAGLAQ